MIILTWHLLKHKKLKNKLNSILPREALVATFKAFVCHQTFNRTFQDKLGFIHYNAYLIEAIRSISRDKLLLGLDSFQLGS